MTSLISGGPRNGPPRWGKPQLPRSAIELPQQLPRIVAVAMYTDGTHPSTLITLRDKVIDVVSASPLDSSWT